MNMLIHAQVFTHLPIIAILPHNLRPDLLHLIDIIYIAAAAAAAFLILPHKINSDQQIG